MGKSVFISYSSKDERYIKKMTQMLEKMGISYWIAPDMIPAGSNYAREIPKAIRDCEIFLLVLSQASQQSIWVEKEIDSAIYYRKTIVPFQIDDSVMTDMFRFYLNNVQTIRCANRPKEAIEELKHRLRSLLMGPKEVAGNITVPNSGQNKDRQAGKGSEQHSAKPEPPKEQETSKTENVTKSEPQEKPDPKQHSTTGIRKKRSSFLGSSGIPTECKYCGGKLEKISQGVYRCKECGKENYDYLRTVRNFLQRNGAKPAFVIERETGVPRKVIEQLISQEYLEIPKMETARLSCVRCGASIRTGTLCDRCKEIGIRTGNSSSGTGGWHSSRRR